MMYFNCPCKYEKILAANITEQAITEIVFSCIRRYILCGAKCFQSDRNSDDSGCCLLCWLQSQTFISAKRDLVHNVTLNEFLGLHFLFDFYLFSCEQETAIKNEETLFCIDDLFLMKTNRGKSFQFKR